MSIRTTDETRKQEKRDAVPEADRRPEGEQQQKLKPGGFDVSEKEHNVQEDPGAQQTG